MLDLDQIQKEIRADEKELSKKIIAQMIDVLKSDAPEANKKLARQVIEKERSR